MARVGVVHSSVPSLTMQSPNDLHISISAGFETIHGKEKIKKLEKELDTVSATICKAYARAREIRRQIKEEKLWLGSIHRIPVELLSNIFILHAQIQWSAPLIDGAVCRRWRSVILDKETSPAWSYIQIDQLSEKGLSQWLYRCGESEIHAGSDGGVGLPILHDDPLFTSLTLDNLSAGDIFPFTLVHPRLRTLQLRQTHYYPEGKKYWMSRGPRMWETSMIDVRRFKSLVCLHLDAVDDLFLSWLAVPRQFPPLQQLVISNAEDTSCAGIIKACSASLLHLEIGFHGIPVPAPQTDDRGIVLKSSIKSGPIIISLPRLNHLVYQIVGFNSKPKERGFGFPFHLETPSLQSYHESQSHLPSPLHHNTSSVSELWLQACASKQFNHYNTNLFCFPSVKTIVTDLDREIFNDLLGSLEADPNICLNLLLIHYYFPKAIIGGSKDLWPRKDRTIKPVLVIHPDSLPRKHVKFSPIVVKDIKRDED